MRNQFSKYADIANDLLLPQKRSALVKIAEEKLSDHMNCSNRLINRKCITKKSFALSLGAPEMLFKVSKTLCVDYYDLTSSWGENLNS